MNTDKNGSEVLVSGESLLRFAARRRKRHKLKEVASKPSLTKSEGVTAAISPKKISPSSLSLLCLLRLFAGSNFFIDSNYD
jgi:hypothetical protein